MHLALNFNDLAYFDLFFYHAEDDATPIPIAQMMDDATRFRMLVHMTDKTGAQCKLAIGRWIGLFRRMKELRSDLEPGVVMDEVQVWLEGKGTKYDTLLGGTSGRHTEASVIESANKTGRQLFHRVASAAKEAGWR